MSTSYDDAVSTLYQAAQADFVAERKRLAAALKASGDAALAAKFAKLSRPPISAWAVNQLWWTEREAFEALFATAKRLHAGERQATEAHRNALSTLRARAATLLEQGGHGTAEATLRRVAATLSALAATGSFDPDPSGALSADRDPPGFEAWGIGNALPAEEDEAEPVARRPARASEKPAPKASPETTATPSRADTARAERERVERERAAAEAREREAAVERVRREKRLQERRRLEGARREATSELKEREREAERLRKDLHNAEAKVAKAQEALAELEEQLKAVSSESE